VKVSWIPGGDWVPNETTLEAMEDARAGRNMLPVIIEELREIAEAEAKHAGPFPGAGTVASSR
jgi:hypothetical protein